jgi:hypothetical protein
MKIPRYSQHAFGLFVAAAVEGRRCPTNEELGPGGRKAINELFRLGAIRSEVYARNWREMEILAGEHAGKRTQSAPDGWMPYYIVDGRGGRYVGDAAEQRKGAAA